MLLESQAKYKLYKMLKLFDTFPKTFGRFDTSIFYIIIVERRYMIMNLGDKILKLRRQKGLSQEQLGDKINVTRQTISNWELGATAPNPEQLKLLSEQLNVSIDELLENKITSSENKTSYETSTNKFNSVIKYIGMFFIDIFVGAGFILLYAWLIVMLLFSIALLAVSTCLIFNLNIGNLIPLMPYWCGVICAIALVFLSILFILASIIYAAFVKKLVRSYVNMHCNILNSKRIKDDANNNGKSILNNKKMLVCMKIAVIGFVLFFMLSLIACTISAGNLAFWHIWNWWA